MDTLHKIFNAVENDKWSGSQTLSDTLIYSLILYYPQLSPLEKEQIGERLLKLVNQKNYFALFNHLATTLAVSDDWSQTLKEYQAAYKNVNQNITDQFIEVIHYEPKTFLLHSNSGTVTAVFKHLAAGGYKASIFQTRSSPDNEGLVQSKKLQEFGFIVTEVDDAPPDTLFNQIDILVTGVDLILPLEFINKKGTRFLAEKIYSLGKPYFVLADPRKFSNTFPSTPLPPTFECIPRNLITTIITGNH